jgi:hypothetical protein
LGSFCLIVYEKLFLVSDKSKIEWTDATWNPMRGCSKVSASRRRAA